MLIKRTKRLFHTNLSITIVLGAIVMLLLFPSCGGKKKAVGEAITERDSLPIMSTAGISTLISDSGVTRYRMNAEEWQVFDRKKPSYWAFEKGVYLEQFDSVFHVEASIKADTAYSMTNSVFGNWWGMWIYKTERANGSIQSCCIGMKLPKRCIPTVIFAFSNPTAQLLVTALIPISK